MKGCIVAFGLAAAVGLGTIAAPAEAANGLKAANPVAGEASAQVEQIRWRRRHHHGYSIYIGPRYYQPYYYGYSYYRPRHYYRYW